MKGEFVNCVYYENGEDDFEGDFIDSTLAIYDDLTIEVFVDDIGIGRFTKNDGVYDAKLVDIILRDPKSSDASDACKKLVRIFADNYDYRRGNRTYARG